MRTHIGLYLFMAAALGAVGCTIKTGPADSGSGGGSSTASSGGAGGGSSSTSGGAGGGVDDPCAGVSRAGECVDAATIRSCFVSGEDGVAPEIKDVACVANTACTTVDGVAACRPVGDCFEGSSRCLDSATLQNCTSGKWVSTACGTDSCRSKPSVGASCTQQDPGTGRKLRGHVDYEFRAPNASFTDLGPIQKEGAVDLFITAYQGDELIGMGLTSPGGNGMNPGDWEIELDREPTGQVYYYFWPMLFDDNGNPRMAIAHAQSGDAFDQESTEYWNWGFGLDCSAGCGEDVGTDLITDAMGSGAAYIYQWLDYGLFRTADLMPGKTPLTVGIFWEPNNQFDCGSCFITPGGGGARVSYDGDAYDHYDTSLNISGSVKSPHHFVKTTINHELGHWFMQSFTKSPAEGGVHYVGRASSPGLAYSEGFATFFAQTNISASPSAPDPVAFRKSQGTTFWVDLEKVVYSGGALEMPDENGGMDQDICEDVVSSLMWSIWASDRAYKPLGKGDQATFSIFSSKRLTTSDANRGYKTVDLVDFLDAATCASVLDQPQITSLTNPISFPYQPATSPQCN